MSAVRGRELAIAIFCAAVLAIAITWPLAARLGRVGRVDMADGQFSIWNVAWVARTLVVDPLHVFDANIFYPHRSTLAYSESNLATGALAIPAYWLSHQNPYAAINFVMLLQLVLSATGMYCLVRYLLTGAGPARLADTVDPAAAHDAAVGAAAVSAVAFAFCPFMLSHTAQIQVMMIAGLPFAMLAFHRLVDAPSPGRGAALGVAMAAEALCSGYYGIFLILMVGFAALTVAAVRGLWTRARFWLAMVVAAVVAIAIVAPAFVPYLRLQRVSGFNRGLGDAARYAADWRAYFASAAYAHAWMLGYLRHWQTVLFPGFVAVVFGAAGLAVAWRARREVAWLYGGFALLALWLSFGPDAGLYTVCYHAIPLFTWMRDPARFGLVVGFALSVLAGFAAAALLGRVRHPRVAAAALVAVTFGELVSPVPMTNVQPLSPAYRLLASLPAGPVIELPFYYPEVGLYQHAKYMLASTAHWRPLVNGYSDYIPPDFYDHVMLLAPFPSRDSFRILEPNRVRYAMFHLYGYNDINRREILGRIEEFQPFLRPLYVDGETRLYEIVAYPH